MPHGKLEVYVEGAVDIKDTNILGKGSPYCTLTMGSQEFSSPPIAEGGTRPFFNTNFEFQVDRTTVQLMVKIFSKKTLTDDDLLGYCTIAFKDAFYRSHVVPVTAYALTRPSGRPGGHIRLSLTFQAKPRPALPPGGAYMPPQPRPAGPYRQPRPPPGVGRGPRPYPEDPSYRRRSHPVETNFGGGLPPSNLPRRMNEEDSSSQSSGSYSDDGNDPAPPGALYQQPVRRPGPPPGPNQPARMRPTPPPPPNTNTNSNSLLQTFGGALVQNVGGALVGALWNADGEGSDWGGGDDEGSIGQIETASYGSAPEELSYYEGGSSAVEEAEYHDDGETSQDAVGAPAYGPYAAGPPPPRGRGRSRGAPPLRGRGGPPVRGRAVPRGRAGPPVGRGGVPIRGVRGRGPPRGGPPPSMARGGPPPM